MATQIVTFNTDGSIKINEEDLERSLQPYLDKSISIVSLTGAFRKGKSTLLTLWSKHDKAFKVGHSVKAETAGIWVKVVEEDGKVLVLLDTEGWNNPLGDRLDVWLPLIAILTSSEFIINVMGELDGILVTQLFSLLTACLYDAREIRHREWKVPSVRVIIRDFDKDLDGFTPDEYLDHVVFHDGDEQRVLRKHMLERKCNTLPTPSDKRNVQRDSVFTAEAVHIWDQIVTGSGSDSRTALTGHEWAKLFVKVVCKVEELRRSDPLGHRIRLNMPGFKVLDKAKTMYAESLKEWDVIEVQNLKKWETETVESICNKNVEELKELDIVTPGTLCIVTAESLTGGDDLTGSLQILKTNNTPYAVAKLEECSVEHQHNAKATIKEAVGTVREEDTTEFMRFAANLHTVVRDRVMKLIQKNYEGMYGTNISLQTFDNILEASCRQISGYNESHNIRQMYLNVHSTMLQSILSTCMQEYVDFEMIEFVKRYDKRTSHKKDFKVSSFLDRYDKCGLPTIKKFTMQKIDSFDLSTIGMWAEFVSHDLEESERMEKLGLLQGFLQDHLSYIERIRQLIEMYYFPYLELQNEMVLLEVDCECVFGNILDIYNCEVDVWNKYIQPACEEKTLETLVAQLLHFTKVRTDDLFKPYIQFKADYKDILEYIKEKRKLDEFSTFLTWAKRHTDVELTEVLTEVAEHFGKLLKAAGDVLDTFELDIFEEETVFKEVMLCKLRRFTERLDMGKEEEILKYELEMLTEYDIQRNEAVEVPNAAEIQSYLRSDYDLGSYSTMQIDAQKVTALFVCSELEYITQIGKLVKLQNIIEDIQQKGLIRDLQMGSVFRNIDEIYNCHRKLWGSVEPLLQQSRDNRKPVDVLELGRHFTQLNHELASYVTFTREEKICLKYINQQLKDRKRPFSQLMGWVAKQKWWGGDAKQLVTLLKLPLEHLTDCKLKLEAIANQVTKTTTNGCLRECVKNVDGLLLEIKQEKKTTENMEVTLGRLAGRKPDVPEIQVEEDWVNVVYPGKTREDVIHWLDGETIRLQEALWEVVTSESSYIKKMAFLSFASECLTELRNDYFKNVEVKSVFSNITQVYQSHKQFFMTMIKPMVEHSKNMNSVAGREPVLLQTEYLIKAFAQLENMLVPLVDYCLSFSKLRDYIMQLKGKKIERFLQWVTDISGERVGLADLLQVPIQRLTKYPLLLEAIKSHTAHVPPALDDVIEHVRAFVTKADVDIKSEFDRKKNLMKTVWEYRIEELNRNMHELVRRNPELCESMVCYHREWWVKRLEAIKLFKRIMVELNDIKLGSNIGKTATGVLGVTASGFAIASMVLPFLSPVAITLGIIVAVSSMSLYGTHHFMSKVKKDQLLGKLSADSNISSKFRTSFQDIVRLMEDMIHHKYNFEDTEDWRDIRGHTLTGVGTVANVGRVACNIADVVTDPIVAAGRVAGAAVGGVGIVFDVLSMGFAIYDMAKNGSKHDLSEYITQCIELMEMEMQYYAKVAIPMKYHLFGEYIRKAAAISSN